LTPNDVVTYAVRRRGGGIGVVGPDGKTATTRAVRTRAIECDVKLLRAMLRWATTIRVDRGARRLLEQNPLDGLKLERESNPRRPVATWERFEKTRTAIAELRDLDPVIDGRGEPPAGPEEIAAAEARRRANRLRWVMLDLVLVIVEATGRRIGAVRQLQWPDIDLTRGRIRWRAATDKKRREWGTPIPIELVEEIRRARGAIAELAGLQAVQGYIFFAATDHTRAVDRDTLNSWLEKAEKRAKLEKLEGGLWHPYRRAWATARKHHPLKDVAAAGGWKDVGTLLTCYTAADDETVLAVMSEPRKVRDAQTAT
jgi:integrase